MLRKLLASCKLGGVSEGKLLAMSVVCLLSFGLFPSGSNFLVKVFVAIFVAREFHGKRV